MLFSLFACVLALPLLSVATDEDIHVAPVVSITPTSSEVLGIGRFFTFNCSTTVPNVTLTLIIDNDTDSSKMSRVTAIPIGGKTAYLFSFGYLEPTDNGTTFMCIASNETVYATSNELTLKVELPTVNISAVSDSILGINDTFAFNCSVDQPDLQLSLIIDGTNSSEKTKRIKKTTFPRKQAAEYMFLDIVPTDNGTTFSCVASNVQYNEMFQSETLMLQVQYAPEFAVASNATLDHFIKTGANGELNCTVSMSNPPLLIFTFSNDSKNTENVKANLSTKTISFTKSKTNNRGNYTCMASNSIGTTTLTYQTFIGGVPDKIKISASLKTPGDQLMIDLKISDYSDAPAQAISVMFDGISDTKTINFVDKGYNIPVKNLVLSAVVNETSLDVFAGNYTLIVTAENQIGIKSVVNNSLFVPGQLPLDIVLVPNSKNVVEGDDYTFRCEALAENITVNVAFEVLIDNSTTGDKHSRLHRRTGNATFQEFTFVNTSYIDDQTTFSCVGNKLDDSDDTTMTVLYKPYFAQGAPNTSLLFEQATGSDFSLTCTVTRANPPVEKLTIEPETGPNWKLVKHGDMSVSLEFTKADPTNNTRTFTCMATNTLTTSKLTFNSYVGGPPDNMMVKFIQQKTNNAINVTLNVTDTSSVPATGVVYYLKGVFKNMTCNIPNASIPLNGSSYLCEKAIVQSFKGLTSGGRYTVHVYGINHVGETQLQDFVFSVPSKKKSNVGVIATSVTVPVAVIALICVAVVVVGFCYYKRKRSRRGFTLLADDDGANINSPGYSSDRVIT